MLEKEIRNPDRRRYECHSAGVSEGWTVARFRKA